MTALFEDQRRVLLELNDAGIPTGAVLTDTISPQYISDLLSWATVPIWATESQVHRELASGVSFPVCFAARDSSSLKLAADAVETAACPHHFVGLSKRGQVALVTTAGNSDCTVRLQGIRAESLEQEEATKYLEGRGIANRTVLDMTSDLEELSAAPSSRGCLVHIGASSFYDSNRAEPWLALEIFLDILSEGAAVKD